MQLGILCECSDITKNRIILNESMNRSKQEIEEIKKENDNDTIKQGF